jgi:hypothetical protein
MLNDKVEQALFTVPAAARGDVNDCFPGRGRCREAIAAGYEDADDLDQLRC